MANKHRKRCSISYVIRKMQIKRSLTISNTGKDVEQQEFSYIADRNAKWYNNVGRQLDGILQNIPLAYNPAIFLGIYLKDVKTDVHMKICTQIFTAILTTIAKPWN